MKEEDTIAQILFWENLNEVMVRTGTKVANFYGYMADEAQAGWRAVRHVFNGGVDNIMEGRERSCLFHWEQSLQHHNKAYIKKESQEKHKELCNQWRLAPTKDEANQIYNQIQGFWKSGLAIKKEITYMESWLSWWGLRIEHWAQYKGAVSACTKLLSSLPIWFHVITKMIIVCRLLMMMVQALSQLLIFLRANIIVGSQELVLSQKSHYMMLRLQICTMPYFRVQGIMHT